MKYEYSSKYLLKFNSPEWSINRYYSIHSIVFLIAFHVWHSNSLPLHAFLLNSWSGHATIRQSHVLPEANYDVLFVMFGLFLVLMLLFVACVMMRSFTSQSQFTKTRAVYLGYYQHLENLNWWTLFFDFSLMGSIPMEISTRGSVVRWGPWKVAQFVRKR